MCGVLYLVKTYAGNEAWDLVFELVFAYELFEERELKATFAPFSLRGAMRSTQIVERQRQLQKDSSQVTQLTYIAPLQRLVAAGPFGAVCWQLEFSSTVSGAAGWHQSDGTDTDTLQTEQLVAWETENQHRLRQQRLGTQQTLKSSAPALHRHEQLFTPLILLALSIYFTILIPQFLSPV